jgi:hypothetical protein
VETVIQETCSGFVLHPTEELLIQRLTQLGLKPEDFLALFGARRYPA